MGEINANVGFRQKNSVVIYSNTTVLACNTINGESLGIAVDTFITQSVPTNICHFIVSVIKKLLKVNKELGIRAIYD